MNFITGAFSEQRPVTRSFDVFFDLHLNKRWNKQSRRRWFQMPSRSLWRHCNAATSLHCSGDRLLPVNRRIYRCVASNFEVCQNLILNEEHPCMWGFTCTTSKYRSGLFRKVTSQIIRLMMESQNWFVYYCTWCMVIHKSYVRFHVEIMNLYIIEFAFPHIINHIIEHSHLIIHLHKSRKCKIPSWVSIAQTMSHNTHNA